MNEQQQRLQDTLVHVVKQLRSAGFPNSLIAKIEMLILQIPQPCVVAVVGRVKAGKSTFINALLGEDLAKIGTTETTATINYFRGGIPNAQLPVRCYWRDGRVSDENRQFLDSLQGNDFETLRKAEGIDHLEYCIQNRYLKHITLVDTPGTGAVIKEHQNRTAEYLNLERQLRERHDHETQHLGSEADAVIYLIGGATATANDQAFLEEFQQATQGQSRSLNAIGVLAKIDLSEELIKRSEDLSKKVATQLRESLNTVIPVSAGMRRALDSLLAQEQAGLKQMMATLRRIPHDMLDILLSDSGIYLDLDCPVSIDERKQIRGDMPWRVFVTIARIAAYSPLASTAIAQNLEAMAGFDALHKILDQHFVKRGTLLRSYRITNDACKIIEDIKFSYLHAYHHIQADNEAKRKRFIDFINHARGNLPVAQELATFVEEQLAPRANLDQIVEEIQRALSMLRYELEEYNLDFSALQQLEDNISLFIKEEIEELYMLFGLYNLEIEKRLSAGNMTKNHVISRLRYWDSKSQVGRTAALCEIAQHAAHRYGTLIETLTGRNR